ncbi:MAG TPA: polysaccharide deacetylase family protein [Flavisolibacter sp.]|nr:polysaccharide deacetylase family protein [Flavisolibacter sp.]
MKNSLPVLFALLLWSCSNSNSSPTSVTDTTKTESKEEARTAEKADANRTVADAATIMARPQVPILCYHHIREGAKSEYEVSVSGFKAQMKALADSGYHTVLPDQLYNYLAYGDPLPSKPVMITYDDTDEEQFSIAKPEMDKYGFKGVYFIMTISIGRPRYMSKEQIKQLSDEGHAVASHTWRHDRVDKYLTTPHMDRDLKKIVNNDWDLQLVDTRKKLEDIIGKEIHYFAYPFGIWSKEGIPELRNRGFKLAFQLSTKRDPEEPLYTVRRIIVPPTWTPQGMIRTMKSSFGETR